MRGRTSRVALLVGLAACLVVPWRARAYRTLADDDPTLGARVTWAAPVVPLVIYERPPRDVVLLDLQRAVRLAAGAWAEPACSALNVPSVAVTPAPAAAGDGVVTVQTVRSGWRELGLSSDVGATTDLVLELVGDTWRVADADVLINDVDFTWSASPQPIEAPRRDLRAVLTHELGHSLASLAHPCERGVDGVPDCASSAWFAEAVMFPEYRGSSQSVLSHDDVAGACAMYPHTECEDVRCAMGTACVEQGACAPVCGAGVCPLDHHCVEGTCVLDSSCGASPCEPRPMCIESTEQTCGVGGPGDVCVVDADCATAVCQDGRCWLSCAADGSCPAPYECSGGSCEPPAGVFGDTCAAAGDCTTDLCLREGDDATCTRPCTRDADCPADHRCGEVSGRAVCRRTPAGCGVGADRSGSGSEWIVSCLLLAAAGVRRRAR